MGLRRFADPERPCQIAIKTASRSSCMSQKLKKVVVICLSAPHQSSTHASMFVTKMRANMCYSVVLFYLWFQAI